MDNAEISNKDLFNLLLELKSDNNENLNQNNIFKEEIIKEIRTTTTNIYKELQSIRSENIKLKEENKSLKEKIDRCERKLKKHNLVFYAIEETDEITDTQKVLEIINDKLNISCNFNDIRDIFRIGQRRSDRVRPILIECMYYKLKVEILKNCRKLKGTGLSIKNDLIQEDYIKEKVLVTHLKKARKDNKEAFIKKNHLFINGQEYSADDLEKSNNEVFNVDENKLEAEFNNVSVAITSGTNREKRPVRERSLESGEEQGPEKKSKTSFKSNLSKSTSMKTRSNSSSKWQ